ncbi:hypothetical protein T484DRAFT_1893138, partial [Baffinella frigidus]
HPLLSPPITIPSPNKAPLPLLPHAPPQETPPHGVLQFRPRHNGPRAPVAISSREPSRERRPRACPALLHRGGTTRLLPRGGTTARRSRPRASAGLSPRRVTTGCRAFPPAGPDRPRRVSPGVFGAAARVVGWGGCAAERAYRGGPAAVFGRAVESPRVPCHEAVVRPRLRNCTALSWTSRVTSVN